MATDEHELDDILEAGHRAEQQTRQEGWDELPEAMEMMYDISRLPNPPADFEPSLADWRRYLESVRPIVEGEYLVWLNEKKVRAQGLGPTKLPDLEQAVPFAVYIEKRHVARVLAWQKERRATAELKPTAVVQAELVGLRQPDLIAIVDPEIMSWRGPQIDLWESQLTKPEPAPRALDTKKELLLLYAEWVLPTLVKKYTATWLVLVHLLLEKSPKDLGAFKISYRQIAAGTELSRRSVQDAMQNLLDLGVLLVVTKPSREENTPGVYSLVPASKLKPVVERTLAQWIVSGITLEQ